MQVEFDRIKRIIEESIDSPLTFPFRRSHIAKVYRGERSQKVVTASFTSVILM